MNEKKITFRMAEEKDAGLVMSFIHHLSVYEEMEGSVQATEELLRENLFRKKGAEVLFALVDGKEVGMALYTAGFAGYLGKQNLFLDTLYVCWRNIEETEWDRLFSEDSLKLQKSVAVEESNGSA